MSYMGQDFIANHMKSHYRRITSAKGVLLLFHLIFWQENSTCPVFILEGQTHQVPVVERLDNAIKWISVNYPLDTNYNIINLSNNLG